MIEQWVQWIVALSAAFSGLAVGVATLIKVLRIGRVSESTHQIVNSQREKMIRVAAQMQRRITKLEKIISKGEKE